MSEGMNLRQPLPVGDSKTRATGWWGIWSLIVTEGSLFGYLLFSYFYLYFQADQHWPPEGRPKLMLPGINTVLLLSSSVFVWLAERYVRRGQPGKSLAAMPVAIVLGIAFVSVQMREWDDKSYNVSTHLYGSLYFIITGFHMAHVMIGLVILSLLMLWTKMGYFTPKHFTPLSIGGLYWHFVDAVWIFIFTSFYLVPYF